MNWKPEHARDERAEPLIVQGIAVQKPNYIWEYNGVCIFHPLVLDRISAS